MDLCSGGLIHKRKRNHDNSNVVMTLLKRPSLQSFGKQAQGNKVLCKSIKPSLSLYFAKGMQNRWCHLFEMCKHTGKHSIFCTILVSLKVYILFFNTK